MPTAGPALGRINLLAGWLCHQKPDRCFTIGGWTMPICSRCTGMYGGIFAAMLVHLLWRRLVPSWRLAGICLIVVLLGGVEVLAEALGWTGGNGVRFASGLVIGGGIGTLLGVGLRTLIRPAPNTRAKARR